MSTLFLVATPIGNLEDLSPRALRILSKVKLIAAEDTRHSRKLLNHFEIKTPLTSYFEHSKPGRLDEILHSLDHSDVALISDAGMPAINDPGYQLVLAAIEAGHEVSPIPGPSAPISALAASGLPTDTFLYLGYLPRKEKARRDFLLEHADQTHTLIFLESPHRLQESLASIHAQYGDRQIAVAAELTKQFERIFRGTLSAAIEHFAATKVRGEFTLVLAGTQPESQQWDMERLQREIENALLEMRSPSDLARSLASRSGRKKSEVYEFILAAKKERPHATKDE